MKVFVNPGHDRVYDSGAVGGSGLREADVVHDVGVCLKRRLEQSGYAVKLVQDDMLMSVINEANAWGADVFVSIHCNGFSSPGAKGTETLYYPTSVGGRRLAKCLQERMLGSLGLADRGIKERRDLAVLKYTSMPAALVEMAFITNPREERILRDGIEAWAEALFSGIEMYFEG